LVEAKRRLLATPPQAPRFLYSHTGPSHSQNSGRCLPNETERYAQRLAKTNIEMRRDIESILSRDREAIIVVMGDHGPYLLGDCHRLRKYRTEQVTRELLLDRLGAFIAIYWGKEEAAEHEIELFQDAVSELLAEL